MQNCLKAEDQDLAIPEDECRPKCDDATNLRGEAQHSQVDVAATAGGESIAVEGERTVAIVKQKENCWHLDRS